MQQLSNEWFQARAGKVTASRIADITARTKSGYSATRANYMSELISERLTGQKLENFTSEAMQWGIDLEPKAKNMYEFEKDCQVIDAGFVQHPEIKDAGASPDGYVLDDGLIEIKCPKTATHINTILTEDIPKKYMFQMQWQMACTNRSWCDFVSFDPRMPQGLNIFIKRVERNKDTIEILIQEVKLFLSELDEKTKALEAKREELQP